MTAKKKLRKIITRQEQMSETLTEYRKGELQKAIEKETDPKKKLELMVEQAEKSRSFAKKSRKRRRRR